MSSRWRDFGFPDLNGVSAEKAIAGLYLAVHERLYAVSGAGCPPEIVNHLEPIWQIETILRGYPTELLLPDGSPYSGEAAAAYLGEELIPVPVSGQGYSLLYPYPPISREWLQQRYRMVNLIYKVRPATVLTRIYSDFRDPGATWWSGATLNEAWDKVDEHSVDSVTENVLYQSWCQVAQDINTQWYCSRAVVVPSRLYYACHLPGDYVLNFYARIPFGGFIFDDFGTGVTPGENTITVEAPADVSFGDLVDFPGASETFARLRMLRTTDSRGFMADNYHDDYYDIRKGLKFYDPIEGA